MIGPEGDWARDSDALKPTVGKYAARASPTNARSSRSCCEGRSKEDTEKRDVIVEFGPTYPQHIFLPIHAPVALAGFDLCWPMWASAHFLANYRLLGLPRPPLIPRISPQRQPCGGR